MQRLVDKIQEKFSSDHCQTAEISVLDGNGDPFRVFSGDLAHLSTHTFKHILRDPCCFYFLTLSAIVKEWSNKEDKTLIYKDLCWLTDPAPPDIVERTHNSLKIKWQSAQYCGIFSKQNAESVIYTLEMCEGVEWRQNCATKYMNDLIASGYKTICSGNNVFSANVANLRPAYWYHFRVVVEHLGLRATSETRSMATLSSIPSPPGQPNLYVIPVPSSFDLRTEEPARLNVSICWKASAANGHSVLKYQAQMSRIDMQGNYVASEEAERRKIQRRSILSSGEAMTNSLGPSSPKANQWVRSKGNIPGQPQRLQISLNDDQKRPQTTSQSARLKRYAGSTPESQLSASLDGVLPSIDVGASQFSATGSRTASVPRWAVIYENLNRAVKLPGPGHSEAEWHIRVRAKNALGWSPYSEILRVSNYTHPSLFKIQN